MKPPSQTQSSPVFEGVYNNARMLHYLTAVVGSTCDVRVKNGAIYEGIFKTLSSQCELAVDAVHKRNEGVACDGGGGGGGEGGGGQNAAPKMEEITDTIVFSPADLVTMTCRDVDLTFAIRDTFTDTAITSTRLNGEHREKVLQRWDGGEENGENFDLDTDTSNGWDANEMFKFNEEAYGVKSTYDSSLSMYTCEDEVDELPSSSPLVPLEKGKSEVYRQREARAARLASEIESSSQYRRRVSLENDEGRSEEDKYSAVVRDREERASPGFSSATREGKYIPLPQRAREMGLNPSTMRGGASPRQPAPTSSPKSPSDRSSPLSVRTAYSPHQLQGSPPAAASPPCSNHTLSHPQTDASRPSVNGVPSRTSPKSQRFQNNRNLRAASSQSSPAIARTVKADVPPQELPVTGAAYLDSSSSSVPLANSKPSGPTPLFPVDVNEILNSAAKERSEALSPQEGKNSKVPSVQQRSQLEELRKFGKEFRLQPSSTPSASPSSPTEAPQAADPKPAPVQGLQQTTELSAPPTTAAAAAAPPAGPEGPMPGGPQPAVAPGSECPRPEGESTAVAAVHVKNSTLNPNAKEFLPIKGPPPLQKPAPTPTPPRQAPPSPSVVLPPLPGQPGAGAIYSSPPTPYLSYVSPFPLQGQSVQAPQMYQYAMTAVSQGKYPRAKGPMVGPRSDPHVSQASSMIQTAASAAGPPLVATPYPQSYLHYGQLLQATPPHYHAQPMYSVLQGGARMLTAGAPPQAMGPTGHQYPGQAEGPQGPQQAIYAPQSFSHHSGAMHRPQPSSTPTGTQPPLQHTAPSPGHAQSGQGGPQPQSIYHSGALSGPSNLPPPHSSQQASYPMQAYSLSPHQALQHGFPQISQLTQAHVAAGMSGPHHPAGHGPPVMLHYAPQQQAPGSNPQQGAHQHYYITPSQAVQVQAHAPQPLTFHPTGN